MSEKEYTMIRITKAGLQNLKPSLSGGETWEEALTRWRSASERLAEYEKEGRGIGLTVQTPLKNKGAWRDLDKILNETGEEPLLLVGRSRIGKSYLLQELLRNDTTRDYFVLVGRNSLSGYETLSEMGELSNLRPTFKGKKRHTLKGSLEEDKFHLSALFEGLRRRGPAWRKRREDTTKRPMVLILEEAHEYRELAETIFQSGGKLLKIILVTPEGWLKRARVIEVTD